MMTGCRVDRCRYLGADGNRASRTTRRSVHRRDGGGVAYRDFRSHRREALIVADRKAVGDRMRLLFDQFSFEVVAVMPADSGRVAEAYSSWGKGVHPARLNLGDCFAYALARERNCPLLYVGDDFSRTDVESAL